MGVLPVKRRLIRVANLPGDRRHKQTVGVSRPVP